MTPILIENCFLSQKMSTIMDSGGPGLKNIVFFSKFENYIILAFRKYILLVYFGVYSLHILALKMTGINS